MTHLDFDLNIRNIKSVYVKTYGVVSFSTKRVIRFDAKEALRYGSTTTMGLSRVVFTVIRFVKFVIVVWKFDI